MYQAFEATIDPTGNIRLNESIQLPSSRRALPEAGPTRNHVRGFVSPHHWRLDALYLAP